MGCRGLQAVQSLDHVAVLARFTKYMFAGKSASSLLLVNGRTFPEKGCNDLQKMKLCIINYDLTKNPQLIHPLNYDGQMLIKPHLCVTFQLYDLSALTFLVRERLNHKKIFTKTQSGILGSIFTIFDELLASAALLNRLIR